MERFSSKQRQSSSDSSSQTVHFHAWRPGSRHFLVSLCVCRAVSSYTPLRRDSKSVNTRQVSLSSSLGVLSLRGQSRASDAPSGGGGAAEWKADVRGQWALVGGARLNLTFPLATSIVDVASTRGRHRDWRHCEFSSTVKTSAARSLLPLSLTLSLGCCCRKHVVGGVGDGVRESLKPPRSLSPSTPSPRLECRPPPCHPGVDLSPDPRNHAVRQPRTHLSQLLVAATSCWPLCGPNTEGGEMGKEGREDWSKVLPLPTHTHKPLPFTSHPPPPVVAFLVEHHRVRMKSGRRGV